MQWRTITNPALLVILYIWTIIYYNSEYIPIYLDVVDNMTHSLNDLVTVRTCTHIYVSIEAI